MINSADASTSTTTWRATGDHLQRWLREVDAARFRAQRAPGMSALARPLSRSPHVGVPTHHRSPCCHGRRKARYRPAGLSFGRAGFAPAGRRTEFLKGIPFFPTDPHCLVASINGLLMHPTNTRMDAVLRSVPRLFSDRDRSCQTNPVRPKCTTTTLCHTN